MSTNLGEALRTPSTITDVCDECGFRPAVISPSDVVLSLRSLPSRWSTALALHLDDADPERVLTARPGPIGWSALEHAGHVRDVLHALDIRIKRILGEQDPVLPETHVTPPGAANDQGRAVVLAAMGVSVEQLARTVEETPIAGWHRTARRAGRTVTALDLAREAVHEGTHHLRLAVDTVAGQRAGKSSRLL